ncbi:MAG: 6-bladed beta-propeller [Balneolia bacterium]|nr:6-bladed beta-propeller [Balneolia bacterium]
MVIRLSFIFTSVLVLLFFSACSAPDEYELPEAAIGLDHLTIHEYGAEPVSNLSLTPVLTISDSDDVIFGHISTVAIDESGRIYITESSRGNTSINVFDSDGSYITTIGRQGAGPGEFRSIWNLRIANNKLYTIDAALLRIQVFELDNFTLQKEIALEPIGSGDAEPDEVGMPMDLHVLNDDLFVMTYMSGLSEQTTHSLYQMNADGNIVSDRLLSILHTDLLPDQESGIFFNDPFSGLGWAFVSAEQELIASYSQDMLFKVYDLGGNYKRAFYHPYTNSPLSRRDALNHLGEDNENFQRALRNNGIPDRWMAYYSMRLDDENRIWISAVTDNKDIYEWRVMDREGKLLGKKEMPRSAHIRTIHQNHLYMAEIDEDTDAWTLVKYRVDLM